ncbi:hypothetical protein FRB95_013619 [Tulasnella sp. JGI-2019a]|nr:hypothetical protein FRB95_013619 [Tulasnella sp. JGI-2019a]
MIMFDDVCLVCGRIAERLYCSDKCRDADAAHLPASSIDHAIDLGFITDSIPPLISSSLHRRRARPPRPSETSEVSSPTSSILTTPSAMDDTDSDLPSVVGPINNSTTPVVPSILDQSTPIKHKVHYDSAVGAKRHHHRPRSGLTDNTAALPFIRRPAHTNVHVHTPLQHHLQAPAVAGSPPSSSSHRRTASFNVASIFRSDSSSRGSPGAPPQAPRHSNSGPSASSSSSRHHKSRSGHSHSLSVSSISSLSSSPVTGSQVVPLPSFANELQLNIAQRLQHHPPHSADHQHHGHHKKQQISPELMIEKDQARKKRARASLPAYFSNLMIGPITSSKVPSAAVSSSSSAAPSPTLEAPEEPWLDPSYVRETRVSGATVKEASAMRRERERTTSAVKLSTSAGTISKHQPRPIIAAPPTRTNSDPSRTNSGVSVKSVKKLSTPTALSKQPTTPEAAAGTNSLPRRWAGQPGWRNALALTTTGTPTRGHVEKGRGRTAAGAGMNPSKAGEAVVCAITATRDAIHPIITNKSDFAPPIQSYAERHIRFIASGSGSGNGGLMKSQRLSQQQPRHHGHANLRSPPPAPLSAGARVSPGGGGTTFDDEDEDEESGSPPLAHFVAAAGTRPPLTPKTRRFSSPTAATVTKMSVPFGLMMSPTTLQSSQRRAFHDVFFGGRGDGGDEADAEEVTSGGEEDMDQDESAQEERGRSRSRMRSRTRSRGRDVMMSRGREGRERTRTRTRTGSRGREGRERERDGRREGRERTRTRTRSRGLLV